HLVPEQRFVDLAVVAGGLRGGIVALLDLEAERVGVLCRDLREVAVDVDGVVAAERLRDEHDAAGAQPDGRAGRNEDGVAVALAGDGPVDLHRHDGFAVTPSTPGRNAPRAARSACASRAWRT